MTDWVTVDQQRIDKFAEATGDFQWIHVDVERTKASSYGGTIAHGFLTLSLLGGFYESYLQHALPFCDRGLNYGLNKIRFTSLVRSGSRLRARFVLAKVDEVDGVAASFNPSSSYTVTTKPTWRVRLSRWKW